MDIDKTLAERGERYGKFADHANIAQGLKETMWITDGWFRLANDQRQALEVIADKIARILNGDPDYLDNWHDIIGYAKLVETRLAEATIERVPSPLVYRMAPEPAQRPELTDADITYTDDEDDQRQAAPKTIAAEQFAHGSAETTIAEIFEQPAHFDLLPNIGGLPAELSTPVEIPPTPPGAIEQPALSQTDEGPAWLAWMPEPPTNASFGTWRVRRSDAAGNHQRAAYPNTDVPMAFASEADAQRYADAANSL
jgi:hypothetical protein